MKRFIKLGWVENEFLVWDTENKVAYGFIYEASDEEIARVAQEYEKDYLKTLSVEEAVDAHTYYDLPETIQEMIDSFKEKTNKKNIYK